MENSIEKVASFNYSEDYKVDVFKEATTFPVDRDYWIINKKSDVRQYLFSGFYADRGVEKATIEKHVKNFLSRSSKK